VKSPVVYPISADLSALLGAAVDVDAGWIEIPAEPETDHPQPDPEAE
jgi:hypothetical protein